MPECSQKIRISFWKEWKKHAKDAEVSPDDGPYTLQGAPLQPIRHRAYQSKPR
jgi:hypothetical protein